MRQAINIEFQNHVKTFQDQVNRELESLDIPMEPHYLYDPVRYVSKGVGKRLRPILVMLVCEKYGADKTDALNAGLAVEMLHNFTLVHDDIMDQDSIRHGQQTVHKHWDESTAILAGDGIYAIAQLLMSRVKSNPLQAVRAFNQATLMVCEGQAYDKEFENDSSVSLDKYIIMIEKKTGWLIGLCAELGGILADLDQGLISCLRSYGLNLGIAFQIQDDILEITSNAKDMGKSLGSDVEAGKQTVLSIMAREKYHHKWDESCEKWSTLDVKERMREVKTFIEQNGILSDAQNLAKTYIEKAHQELIKFSPQIDDLHRFSEMVLNRKK